LAIENLKLHLILAHKFFECSFLAIYNQHKKKKKLERFLFQFSTVAGLEGTTSSLLHSHSSCKTKLYMLTPKNHMVKICQKVKLRIKNKK
jgi:hypothetical protein